MNILDYACVEKEAFKVNGPLDEPDGIGCPAPVHHDEPAVALRDGISTELTRSFRRQNLRGAAAARRTPVRTKPLHADLRIGFFQVCCPSYTDGKNAAASRSKDG